jgi:membrane protease YdiL (CAAX protease family)
MPESADVAPRAEDRVVNVAGLRLPWRETVVVLVTTFVLLIDFHHDLLLPIDPALSLGLERMALYLVVPLAALLLLREAPSAYGLRLGEWRIGLGVAVGLSALVTPIVLLASGLPDFVAYYGVQDAGMPAVLGRSIDVLAAEFLFRGFLMFTLIRLAGPMGVVLATFPFVFSHLGKPELETLSTFFGGLGFGWLAWRTRSVLYGGLLHAYVVNLVVLAAQR